MSHIRSAYETSIFQVTTRIFLRISDGVAVIEKIIACALIGIVAILILLNVFTRYFGYALYWVDELAIYTMVWATFIASSLLVRQRGLVSVTLVMDMAKQSLRYMMHAINDILMLVFSCFFVWLCWQWYSPLELMHANFDTNAFAMDTGNFIYGEPTNTIGIRKFWFWLIMPIFSITIAIHSLANCVETFFTGRRIEEADEFTRREHS